MSCISAITLLVLRQAATIYDRLRHTETVCDSWFATKRGGIKGATAWALPHSFMDKPTSFSTVNFYGKMPPRQSRPRSKKKVVEGASASVEAASVEAASVEKTSQETSKKQEEGQVKQQQTQEQKQQGQVKKPTDVDVESADVESVDVEYADVETADVESLDVETVDVDSVDVESVSSADVQESAVDKDTPKGRRKKGSTDRYYLFTSEQEQNLVDWWKENEFLYNSTLNDYYDKGMKDRCLRAKAKEFGCTPEDITRRQHSLRTDLSRILRVGPSGRGADGTIDGSKLHDKDRIIWDKMSFLKDHIKPRESRSTLEVNIKNKY